VGLYVYSVHVVPAGFGLMETNLIFDTSSGFYIVDEVKSVLSFNQESSTEDTIILNLFLTYAYDNQPVLDYTVVIRKNGQDWQTTSSDTISDIYEPDIENTYALESVVERTHGLTTLNGPAPFIVSSDVFNSDTGSSIDPEDVIDIFRYAMVLGADLGTLFFEMYSIVGSVVLEFLYQFGMLTGPFGLSIIISLVVVSSVMITVSSVMITIGRQLHRKDRLAKNSKRQKYFQASGGLEVYSMIYSGKPAGDYHVVPQGVSIPWVILDDYEGTIARSLKLSPSEVERPKVIIRLYSTPVKDRVNGFSIYGLI
jgi:hypothetical protein